MSLVLLDSLRVRSKGNYNLVREEKSAMWYIILSRSLPEKQKSQKQNYEEHRQWLDDQHRAGRLLFSGPTADRAWNLYHARFKQERSEAHRGSRPASRQRHSKYGSVGMEPPSRLSAQRPHDRGRRAHGGRELLDTCRSSYYRSLLR